MRTLFVIPDTQGYTEDWREQGYLYEEMVATFKWLLDVSDRMNVQVIQPLEYGATSLLSIGRSIPQYKNDLFKTL